MAQSNGGEVEADDDDWILHPIADTSDRKRLARTAKHIVRETAVSRQWRGFPQTGIAIGGNGAGDRLVFLKDGDTFGPQVFAWSHETGELQKVADDFGELI